MRASELQAKDVVDIADGKKLGTIGDLEIDIEQGMIKALIIPPASRFFGFMSAGEEIVINWTQIVKIGSDVVLVDLTAHGDGSYTSYGISPFSNDAY